MSKYHHQVNTLLLQIKNGDQSKLTDLHNLTYNHLKYVALHYIFNKNNFEDVLNEAYYRTLKYIKSFSIFKDGYNWLCRIIQNVAMDMNRENSQYVLCEDVLIDDFNFEEEIDRRLKKDALYRYVKTLPQIDRKIIYYKYYLDWTYDRISKKINRSKSFVYSRIKIIEKNFPKNFENY